MPEEGQSGRVGGLASWLPHLVVALSMAVVTVTGLLIWWVKR